MRRNNLSRDDQIEIEEILERRHRYETRKKRMRKLYILGIIFAVILGFFVCWKIFHKSKPKITSNYIYSKLEDASDLTTQKMTYQGVVHYSEGDIPFITQKKYSMTYTAEIDAGVDLSKVKVDKVGNDEFNIVLPEVEIQGVHVDPESVAFYDESHALFNWNTKEDGVKAVQLAEEDAVNNADIEQLKKDAEENAKKVINDLLQDSIKSGNVTVN